VDNAPVLTAYANDVSYDNVFSEQLDILAEPGDILIVFSGSGTSKNIVNAVDYGINHYLKIIAFVGITGGLVYWDTTKNIDYIHINSDMLHSEDWFSTVSHILPIIIKEMSDEN
jgi:phosphoheptose isomerase